MRVTLDHLRGDGFGHLRRVEASFFGRDLSVHRDLQEKVAQLLHHLRVIAGVDRLEQLVSLFEQVLA